MSDIIKAEDSKVVTELGMLFLFDVVGSSDRASNSENLTNKIFYQKITLIVKNVVDELNQTYRYGVQIAQCTGDGFYIFCKELECCLQLWMLLCRQFDYENIPIKCGASYGKVNITQFSIGSHLANIVSRCCSFSNSAKSLVITSTLYDLIQDCSLFYTLSPKIECIENPKLKGCPNIDKIYKLDFTVNNKKAQNISNNSDGNNIFIGRDETLEHCKSVVEECFSNNKILNIMGVSGVGKTTIAICVSNLLHYNIVCVDLRQITDLVKFHRLVINILFKELQENKLTKEVEYCGEETLISIFSSIKNIVVIFDHAELFSESKYKGIVSFLPTLNKLNTHVILTSTCSQSSDTIPSREWVLVNPTDEEKFSMLSYWIQPKNKAWLKSLAHQITNHSYLICLIGYQFKGIYKRKKDLVRIENYIKEAEDVSNFLKQIINQLPINVRFWIYLAYLGNGNVLSQAIPNSVFEKLTARGLIQESEESVVFHPLVMRAVESEYCQSDLEKIVYEQLCSISEEKSKTIIEYYKFLCLEDKYCKKKSEILFNNWQAWSEEIDSYKAQALIEKSKLIIGLEQQKEYFDLFLNIVHIFQGGRNDLELASRVFKDLYDNQRNPTILRLLAKIEFIECQRKLNGPNYSIQLIYDDLDSINNMLHKSISDDYEIYGKYYYLGTFFFLIGNILRSIEDHCNAIQAYQISLKYINKEETELRNAELQKVHIAYGIAESHLMSGQNDLAIELANESIRTIKTTAKFGIALLHLLKARAYLCSSFSNMQNYRDALSSVKKAEELFVSIRLPNYIRRCNFIEGAIYTKKRRLTAARNSFNELINKSSETDEMIYRVNILLNYMNNIRGAITYSHVSAITKRKGKQIGRFYCKLSGIEHESSCVTDVNTIKINDNQIEKSAFVFTQLEMKRTFWLVD